MQKAELDYRGRKDQEKLIDFLNQVNLEVKTRKMPTNLYTHTNSPIDIAILDFHHFDPNEIPFSTTDMCIVPIHDNSNKVINHIIMYPFTKLSIEFTIVPTDGPDPYDYLALRLQVKHL